MSICTAELRDYVIRPTLDCLNESSVATELLLLGTAAQESGLGFHLKDNTHPGIGLFGITPKAHKAVWDTYIVKTPELASDIRGLASQHEFLKDPDAELVTNLRYATAIALMIYKSSEKPIPEANDYEGLAKFWQTYYRPLSLNAGNWDDFLSHFKECIAPKFIAAA
jgi:hypothetical protein